MRNYKRYLGVLIDTRWTLEELELGVIDKYYDVVDDKTYYEKKVIKIKVGSITDLQWIKERKPEEEFEKEVQAELEKEQQQQTQENKTDINETTVS
ncbi:MAG: hypothetical protein K6T73_08150 [Candidatus Bathyarchaeota archaeon]|nr:hypothetical protein [Candidatus Bathyarchaeota archaeon]